MNVDELQRAVAGDPLPSPCPRAGHKEQIKRSMHEEMSYDDFLAMVDLPRGASANQMSKEDYKGTEVTIYDDGTGAYTDGGQTVELSSRDAAALSIWRSLNAALK